MEPESLFNTVVIDPVCPEFNRGSFAYLPYLVYSAYKAWEGRVALYEDFGACDVDHLPPAYKYKIALWSHTQIEHVQTLVRFLPREADVKVFGYNPLIRSLQLPHQEVSPQTIQMGMTTYVRNFDNFKQILLSDCDMHLRKYEGQVYPMFTSYGCPNGCAFCPSTTNQSERLILPLGVVLQNLTYMKTRGWTNIHFTDEDFFFSPQRTHEIVKHLDGKGFNLIALATRHTLARYLEEFGSEELDRAGFRLLEVGLETADNTLSRSMGKGGIDACERLAQACSVPILWLTLTFFPGETIRTLGATGQFLKRHGLPPEDLYSRIATNGTQGGLGQFFQPYEGTRGFQDLRNQGEILTNRPLRLLPSFIPLSFKESIIQTQRVMEDNETYWFDLYRVHAPPWGLKNQLVRYAAGTHWNNPVDGYVSLAIAARLGIIT